METTRKPQNLGCSSRVGVGICPAEVFEQKTESVAPRVVVFLKLTGREERGKHLENHTDGLRPSTTNRLHIFGLIQY